MAPRTRAQTAAAVARQNAAKAERRLDLRTAALKVVENHSYKRARQAAKHHADVKKVLTRVVRSARAARVAFVKKASVAADPDAAVTGDALRARMLGLAAAHGSMASTAQLAERGATRAKEAAYYKANVLRSHLSVSNAMTMLGTPIFPASNHRLTRLYVGKVAPEQRQAFAHPRIV
jgi:hypothetical protein